MAAGDIKQAHGASSALTITLASLGSDASLVTGRETTAVDNSTNLYLDYLLSGKITTGTSPTASKKIEVWVFGQMDDSGVWPDVLDGTDSAETFTSRDILLAAGKLAASMNTDSTSDRTYYFGPVSVASLFGGVLPKKFVVFVTHNTGVVLNATAGNHAIYISPVYETVAT